MSSLSAARADNFYYPPDYCPEKHGSKNRRVGSKGASQWERDGLVRFAVPFPCRCNRCNDLVDTGVRFNAKKDSVGHYLSVQIFRFAFACPQCKEDCQIETDPATASFKVVKGLRRIRVIDEQGEEPKEKFDRADPFGNLEHVNTDRRKAKEEETILTRIQKRNERAEKNDYLMNSLLRSKNRVKRKEEENLAEEGAKLGLSFPMLPPDPSDADVAKVLIKLETSESERMMPTTTKKRRRVDRISKDPFLNPGSSKQPSELQVQVKRLRKRKREKSENQSKK